MTQYEKSASTLELPAILAMLAHHAVSDEAKARAAALSPSTDAATVQRLLAETSAARGMMVKRGSPSFSGVKDVRASLSRADMGGTLNIRELMDIAGVRVICSYIHDVYNLLELLQKQDDLEIVEIKDYINNPKLNGYRSLHVIVRIPVYFLDKKELIPVEVQLRTIAMDFWASLEHDLKYKSVSEVQGIDSYDELKDCSRIIEDVESRMQILARALEMED